MKVISRQKVKDFLYHKVDGTICSHEGISKLYDSGLITAKEYRQLVDANIKRLQEKVSEWRIAEKIACVLFAALLGFMSITAQGDEMVRRSGRRSGRRNRNELLQE